MATVLIAEDEYLVRVGLRTCIDWEGCGFTLLEDAANGEEAYQRILQYRPDILLLDLKMPRMNGFELLERLKSEEIRLSTIILSCCDDFESVRTALHYGVIDYLNKLTLNSDELLRVLDKAPKTAAGTKRLGETGSVELWPKESFEKLITGGSCTEQELSVLFPAGYVAYLLFIPGKREALPHTAVLLNIITQQLKGSGVTCVSYCESTDAVSLLLPDVPGLDALFRRLCQRLNAILDASCAVGLSSRYANPSEIPTRYALARQIRTCTYWETPDLCRAYSAPLGVNETRKERFRQLKNAARHCLLAHSREGSVSAVRTFGEEFAGCGDISPNDYVQFCLSMLKLFGLESLENHYFVCQQTIIKSTTAEEAKGALIGFVQRRMEVSGQVGNGRYSPIVETVIRYVIDHPEKIIQLSEAAQHASVSESYLSQLFKKETGENYISYVHRYKMNLAKEMLAGPMLVYEVCEQIGFENANYFSKIFRRYLGCTPTQYKKTVRGEG